MTAAEAITTDVGVKPACDALGVSRATLYRRRKPKVERARTPSPRALSDLERQEILDVLCDERFQDASPAQVYATLLDEGVRLASVSTMYRILAASQAVRERRAIARHPAHAKPELVATGPNQVWTWDITKIRGPGRRCWYHLYVVIDIFSRYVVGWMLAETESAALAGRFLAETLERWGIEPGTLRLHADRGTSMTSKTVAELLSDLGVTKSHSRPRTSNDNPFSEAQFKTMKYSLYFPGSFAGIGEGRGFFELFMNWYNQEHHHSGIAMMTPATVHLGRIDEVIAIRQATLDAAYERHPERFVRGRPVAARPSGEVWINRPTVEVQVAEQQTSEVGAGAPQEEPHAETGALQGGHPCEPERRADEPAAGAR